MNFELVRCGDKFYIYATVKTDRGLACISTLNIDSINIHDHIDELQKKFEMLQFKQSNSNTQIIKDFLELYQSGGMRTIVKVDKLALTETTLFKQFMTAIAEECAAERSEE